MDKIVFTYMVTHDTGFAPCVDNGILTLACCKGGTETVNRGLRYFIGRFFEENLQESAEVYVSGIYDNKLLYISKIDKAITMKEYFSNNEYKGRLDQIYRLNGEKLERDPYKLKGVHDDEHSNKCDINGKYVLISNEFVYFGNDTIGVDGDILKYYLKKRGQLPKGQHSYTPADVLTDENKKSKEDHMRNSQLKPAYNVQIAVDAEYIVATEIFNDRTDVNTFIPFMEKIKNNLGIEYMYPTADAGYESEENYTYFEKNGQKPCIKPANYEQTKTRKYRNDIGKAENMQYDENTDTYTCHYGRKLVNVGVRKSKTSSGYISEKTMYQCEGCGGCPHKAQCIKHNARCNTPLEERTKRFELSKVFKKQREKMLERINTEQGILLRINRSIQVEGAFGVIKEDMGFRRFLTRGTANVRTEILLLCLAYNIQKLHNKTIANRQGQFMHEIKAA